MSNEDVSDQATNQIKGEIQSITQQDNAAIGDPDVAESLPKLKSEQSIKNIDGQLQSIVAIQSDDMIKEAATSQNQSRISQEQNDANALISNQPSIAISNDQIGDALQNQEQRESVNSIAGVTDIESLAAKNFKTIGDVDIGISKANNDYDESQSESSLEKKEDKLQKLQSSQSKSYEEQNGSNSDDIQRTKTDNSSMKDEVKPSLNILNYVVKPDEGNAIDSNQQYSIARQIEEELLPTPKYRANMVNRESSPLSPVKKRYLLQSQNSAGPESSTPENRGSNIIGNLQKNSPKYLQQSNHTSKSNIKNEIQFQGLKLLNTHNNDYVNKSVTVLEKKNMPSANPILPKVILLEPKRPPECPLKDIQFVQIQKFKMIKEMIASKMGEGYDQVGKKNMMRENREKRAKYEQSKKDTAMRKGLELDDDQAKMDEFTHIIQNIVYARDPKIFDTKNKFVNQRTAFMHENMLDIKNLIRVNEEKNGRGDFGPRILPPKRIQKTKQQINHEHSLFQRAHYKLRETEPGKIDRNDKTLQFESRFESGNLYLAQKVSDIEYNLLMQNDINTNGHTQWFFYQVKNTRKNMDVTFNIMNFTKPDSLFNYGMKISIYSEISSQKTDEKGGPVGWFKGGDRISYFANGIKKDICYTSKGYYTASFSHKFQHDDDTVYFAFCFPYSYSDLMADILEIEQDPKKRVLCTRKTLCKTLAGVDCDVLTITEKEDFEKMNQKKAVVISARVHPGETVGSWMMRGVLFFLTDPDNEEAKLLRKNFIFKIIPMLNPDGVINGNYRCSLAGCDLNRRWKVPHKQLHPTIYHTKKLIIDIHKERGLLLYCDLHGHSRKQNVFMYGCNNKQKPEECRIFPLILSKLSEQFYFGSCRFGVQKSKESTARISLFKELGNVPNIFTMESTFSGIDHGKQKGQHMTQDNFQDMGKDLCRALLIYSNIYVPEELKHLYGPNEDGSVNNINSMFAKELQNNSKLISAGDGDSSGGSDSEPSDDNLPLDEVSKVVPIVDKQQKLELQKLLKKKAAEQKEQEKKPVKQKPLDPSPTRSPQPRQRSPIKKPQTQDIIQIKPVEEKKDVKKKPDMRDAQTQTERSDYQRIKKQQQQLRMMQEMKDQRLRSQNDPYQAQFQYKSPDKLVKESAFRKTPQSQTGKRNPSGNIIANYALSNQIQSSKQAANIISSMNGQPQMNERQLQDMRNPNKYQLSNDKYSLFQVQQVGAHQKTSSIFQNSQIQNQTQKNNNIVQMSQINSINSGFGGVKPPQQQQLNPRSINMQQSLQTSVQQQQLILNGLKNKGPPTIGANTFNSVPQFKKTISNTDGKINESKQENVLDNKSNAGPNPNNLRGMGPTSTIGKAGEQLILQKAQNFNSPKKSNQLPNLSSDNTPTGNTASSNNRTKHDLRFQIQSITSSHFGGIQIGANMQYVKDNGLQQNNLKGGKELGNNPQSIGMTNSASNQHQLLINIQNGKNQNNYSNQRGHEINSQPAAFEGAQQVTSNNTKRRSSQGDYRKNFNQSQINNVSRNYQDMDNIQLFQSPTNNTNNNMANPMQQYGLPTHYRKTMTFAQGMVNQININSLNQSRGSKGSMKNQKYQISRPDTPTKLRTDPNTIIMSEPANNLVPQNQMVVKNSQFQFNLLSVVGNKNNSAISNNRNMVIRRHASLNKNSIPLSMYSVKEPTSSNQSFLLQQQDTISKLQANHAKVNTNSLIINSSSISKRLNDQKF